MHKFVVLCFQRFWELLPQRRRTMNMYQKSAFGALAALIVLVAIVATYGQQALIVLAVVAAIAALLTLSPVRWGLRRTGACMALIIGVTAHTLKLAFGEVADAADSIRARLLGKSLDAPSWDRINVAPSRKAHDAGVEIFEPQPS